MSDNLSLFIEEDGSVWIGLPDEDPIRSPFGFCLGDRSEAVRALEDVVDRLQQPQIVGKAAGDGE